VILGGEAVPASAATRWKRGGFAPGARLYNMYGITEVTVHATSKVLEEPFGPGFCSIGSPLPGVRIVLCEGDRPVPDGTPGEVLVAGGGLASGYYGRPGLTAERFPVLDLDGVPRRWYRSGDYAVRTPDGELVHLGRRDEQIKVRGNRVELGEIEHVLRAHPAVQSACVVAVETPGGDGVEPAAALVAHAGAGQRPAETALREWVADRLPPVFVPRSIRWLDRMPSAPNGKTDRALVRELLAAAPPADSAAEPAADPLAGMWAMAVTDTGYTAEDGFLSLGGQSLQAAGLVAGIRTEFGVDLGISALLKDNLSLRAVREIVAAGAPAARRAVAGAPVERWPLTPAQRRLWLLSRLAPESAAHNVVGALCFGGTPSADAIKAAVTATVRRHDSLCARLPDPDAEEPGWVVDGVPEVPVLSESVAGVLDDDAVVAFARRIGGEPITMDTAPLVRAGVAVTDAGDRACLVLSLHHLVADQVSLDLLFDDVVLAYRGDRPTEPAPSFGTYAQAAVEEVGGAAWSRDLAYWRRLLAGVPTEVRLPFRMPGATRSDPPRRTVVSLEPPGGPSLGDRLRHRAVTPFTFVVTAISVVVAAWSAQATVVVGTPAVRRRSAAENRLVGFLLSTLPIRVDVGAHRDFASLLDHVRDRCSEAMEHDTPPFDAIVDALGVPTDPARNPVFNVWINDVSGAARPREGATPVERIALPPMGALFELNFYLHQDENGYRLELVHSARGIPPQVADELVRQVRLVAAAVEEPAVPLRELSLVTAEAERSGATFERVVPGLPASADLVRTFFDTAAVRPGEPALVVPGHTVSYAELGARVDRLAALLAASGVLGGDLVEIRADRSAHLPVALLSAWRAGAVVALLDSALPADRLARMHTALGARWVLTLPSRWDHEPELRVAAPSGRSLEGASHILFTSGTSGKPDAVVTSRSAFAAAMSWYVAEVSAGPADRFAMLSGAGHDPVLRDALAPLLSGGTLVVPSPQVFAGPAALTGFLRDSRVTVLHTTPALLEMIVAAPNAAEALATVRVVVSGGERFSTGLLRRLRKHSAVSLVNVFGTTETPQVATWYEAPDPDVLPVGGVPIGVDRGTAVAVVVTPGGGLAGVGQRGEVLLRGRYLAEGYLTGDRRRAFTGDPGAQPGVRAFRTGDLGRLDPWGRVHLDGRADRQVQINGFRVELAEVEMAALQVSGVSQAAAAMVATPVGDVLALWVVPVAGRECDGRTVRRKMRQVLPAHAVPVRVEVVPALKATVNHKVLPGGTAGSPVTPAKEVPGDGLLDVVLRQLQHLLGRDVFADENFFEAGLNSISILRLHSHLVRELEAELDVADLFAYPSAATLARRLETGEGPARPRKGATDPGRTSRDLIRELRREARNSMRRAAGAGDGEPAR
jgi:amino acid adenylation domain-containing protein